MRYDVQQQVDNIDKALFILRLREIPNMKQPTEEEFGDALKKAESCMKLMIHEMIRQDKTMKEMYNNKSIKHKRITNSELLELPLGSKIIVIWHNSSHHPKNAKYYGVIFGDKIGYEDGEFDDTRTIAERMFNDWCMVYLITG